MMQNMQFDFAAARALPQNIRFGTSSWTYPGWAGLVYQREYKNEQDLKHNCLEEYGRFPWFRAVGIDSTFYSPPSAAMLRRYAAQLPQSILWVSKVWEDITIARYARHARYGSNAGKPNPDFLNADKFAACVVGPYLEADVADRAGPFVFEFQMFDREYAKEPGDFLERLDSFLAKLPVEFQYAVEIRTPSLLCPAYFAVLNKHKVTHCFNHWTFMPGLAEQMRHAAESGGLAAPFFAARILTPRGTRYDKAVERFRPYDSIKAPLDEMRKDVVRLARRAMARSVTAFILVNNRAEGNAPLTIDAIGRMINAETGVAEPEERNVQSG